MNADTARAIALAKKQIREDIDNGRVSEAVTSFADLHNYVDANEYGGLCSDAPWVGPDGSLDQTRTDDANEVQDHLDAWVKAGGHHLPVDPLALFHGPDFGEDD